MHQQLISEQHNRSVTKTQAKDIPPYEPHWETYGVHSVKLHLQRVIGSKFLTFEQIHALLAQIEAVISSRPLGYALDTDLNYPSPSHILIGRPATMVPEDNLTEIQHNFLKYWPHMQCMYQGFWRKWGREYLASLQHWPQWAKIQTNIEKDDIVLAKEDNSPPSTWVTGKIIETFTCCTIEERPWNDDKAYYENHQTFNMLKRCFWAGMLGNHACICNPALLLLPSLWHVFCLTLWAAS